MAQVEFRSENSTHRRYICICSGSVSGWTLVLVRPVELGRIMGDSAGSVPFFGAMEVLDARKNVIGA